MDNGWIKIHRKLLDWEWFCDDRTFKLFMFLLLDCNFKKTRWRGIELEIGETIKSLEAIAEKSFLSIQNVRTAIIHLKSTGELTERFVSKFRILKLKNYVAYQVANTIPNREVTGNQQGSNTEVTAYKEGKKERKKERKESIVQNFEKFWHAYPRKINKKKAETTFKRIPQKLFNTIMQALEVQKQSDQWQRDDGQYIPHPTTWLNGKRWEDEIKTEKKVYF